MPRFIDFDRSDREIPFGSMAEYLTETLGDRQFHRQGQGAGDDEVAVDEAIRLIVAQVDDVMVPGGCIASKVRPDRKYLELALRRIVQGRPPRKLAADFGLSRRYAKYCVEWGRRIIDRIGFDGIQRAILSPQPD